MQNFRRLAGLDIQTARRNFNRPKNREDSSDLDENLTDRIAALKSIISEIFRAARLQKQRFQKFFRASCGLVIYRCLKGVNGHLKDQMAGLRSCNAEL